MAGDGRVEKNNNMSVEIRQPITGEAVTQVCLCELCEWPNRRDRNISLSVGLAGLGYSLHMAKAHCSEEELGDLQRVKVSPTPRLHVCGWQEVVPGEHAQHQGQPAALQEVVLEVTGVLTQSGTGWHQQSIDNLEQAQEE